MTIYDVLSEIRNGTVTEREKGAQFERLMQRWLKTDPRFAWRLDKVWLWSGCPFKDQIAKTDVGIDLVAKTHEGEYWAVQCKCYQESAVIDKSAVDAFLATSSRSFKDEAGKKTTFAHCLFVSTTNHWNKNAEEAIQNQTPPVSRLTLTDLDNSPVVWEELLRGKQGKEALKPGKNPMPHQAEAIRRAKEHFKEHDRGKLIMACGTGKTYTSLRLAEDLLGGSGLVLFMVPSIALLGQALNDWSADAKAKLRAICICSDNKASELTERGKKKSDDDFDDATSLVDLPAPASTNVKTIAKQLELYRGQKGLTVVFSTYQSIDVVSEAQKKLLKATHGEFGEFDLIICDEAHRTTGVEYGGKTETSDFQKIHKNELVRGKKRLYMTATPRLYGEGAKDKVKQQEGILYSMDDESVYGQEFYRVSFDYAVQSGILTDYKVLVLTVSEKDLPPGAKSVAADPNAVEFKYDDACKLVGVINALSKRLKGDGGKTFEADPRLMRRALAYTFKIGSAEAPGTSKNVAAVFPKLSEIYADDLVEADKAKVVHVQARHVDGSMHAPERNAALAWLAEEPSDPQECRVISNVRCLSEGVDVPALDAVIFLSARNSQVDVVQSVGRVMRSFHKGQSDEKKYGYIIIPVVVPENTRAVDILNDNKAYSVVWSILNALRSHDDHFNAIVNSIALNKEPSSKISLVTPGLETFNGFGAQVSEERTDYEAGGLSEEDIARQLNLRYGELKDALFAKLVEKCGDRLYWETWAKSVGETAKTFIERIGRLVKEGGKFKTAFEDFVGSLRQNLNPGLAEAECIEMLAQHMITRPVFEALFAEYEFVKNNSVSRSMQQMLDLMEAEAFGKDLEELEKFYASVRANVGNIDNLAGKQTIIKTLYEKFFKGAFPTTTEQLGIVYTPVECVDFIIRSVDDVLRADFGTALTNKDVNILDPFTGTGTFITRLLQTGVIEQKDMVRKYKHEIHANELNMLAYYVADVNIESVFQEVCPQREYLDYDGICLTDTFQLYETAETEIEFKEYLRENSEAVNRQKRAKIQVIMGNPPYSVGQKSANDNAQNQHYEKLEQRIASTYAKGSKATSVKALYDSYIKAFRWATDRLDPSAGGVVAFISNGAWLDGNGQDMMRACIEGDFDKVYVFNLRGNARTSGELRRRERDSVFGQGTRTPITITLLVKLPKAKSKGGKAEIFYHDIGDYLSREEKLGIITRFGSLKHVPWVPITPNAKHDWINQRDSDFDSLIPLFPERKFDAGAKSFFSTYSLGVNTNRDVWDYNFGRKELEKNIERTIAVYNEEVGKFESARKKNANVSPSEVITDDATKISWSSSLTSFLERGLTTEFQPKAVLTSMYRPFTKQHLYFGDLFIHRRCQFDSLFPTPKHGNLVICVSCVSSTKDLSVLLTDCIPDLHAIGDTQCFPMFWYEELDTSLRGQQNLFDQAEAAKGKKYRRHEAVTDWILREAQARYGTKDITKEHIFYYVYGLLHSPEYRERYAADLKKSLPRIPLVKSLETFKEFMGAGKSLAFMHLTYDAEFDDIERSEKTLGVSVKITGEPNYRVEKMRFGRLASDPKKPDKSKIVFNGSITIEGIPARAYDYVVNGKSAIEWLMERYAVTQDQKSGIVNDPNLWAEEHKQPRYILDLLLSVIQVSVCTMAAVEILPSLEGEPTGKEATFEGGEIKVTEPGKPQKEGKAAKPEKAVGAGHAPTAPEPAKGAVKRTITLAPVTPAELEGKEQDSHRFSIKEQPFYQIMCGVKEYEFRELKPTTEAELVTYECEGKTYARFEDIPVGGSEIIIRPKPYGTLRLDAGAYSKTRDYGVFEVAEIGIEFIKEELEGGKLEPKTSTLKGGRQFPHCLVAYRLGALLASKVTKEVEFEGGNVEFLEPLHKSLGYLNVAEGRSGYSAAGAGGERPMLISIRSDYTWQIFDTFEKQFEYRTLWPKHYSGGRVFVYESGSRGSRQVIGFFEGGVPEQEADGYLAIPILRPRRFKQPMTLEEFSRAFGVKVKTAPQAWQYVDVSAAAAEALAEPEA